MDDMVHTAMNKEGEVEMSRDAVLALCGKKGGWRRKRVLRRRSRHCKNNLCVAIRWREWGRWVQQRRSLRSVVACYIR
jgi:hypothetical protein